MSMYMYVKAQWCTYLRKIKGRSLLLGQDLDKAVQEYIEATRAAGRAVNTAIVLAAAFQHCVNEWHDKTELTWRGPFFLGDEYTHIAEEGSTGFSALSHLSSDIYVSLAFRTRILAIRAAIIDTTILHCTNAGAYPGGKARVITQVLCK